MNSFEELELWKEGRKLRNEVSKLANTFPPEEKYKLIDQLLRSSRSITTNIAEGYINTMQFDELRKIYVQYLKLLNGYVLYLKNKKAAG